MTRLLLLAGFVMVTGFGTPANAGTASPPQTGRTDPGSWLTPDVRLTSNLLLVINQDQFAGNWKQLKGDLKQKWSAFTDDDLLYIEGSYDKYEGKLQERYGDRTEEVKQWMDEWFKRHHPDPEDRQATH